MLSSGLTFSGAAAALLSASAVAQAAVAPTSAGRLHARQSTGEDKCTDVHVFLAKGNNEPYPGRQGKLVNAICEGYDSCDYEDIVMQNMLPDPYCDSVHEGGANTVKQVVAYNKKCPDTKLVLSGYSQGSHVIGDSLSGGGGVFFNGCVEKAVEPLDPKSPAGKAVAAILTFGDTRHTANQPWNHQSGAKGNGLFPRPGDQLDKLNAFADRYRDYCVDTDSICSGADPNNPGRMSHLTYFDNFTDEAAKWVKEKLGDDVKKGDPSKTKPPVASTDVSSASASASASGTTLSNLPGSSATDSAAAHATDSTTTGGAAQGSESDKPDSGAGMTLAPLGLCTLAFAAGVAIVMG
ncbi:acetylxylan esterase 2 [Apiospora rasikravindrae]|uniref:Cutinase n=1 Tax=Apiospora rasikravindrae TaxID=990691 RepID=A0ABR1U144_9PEZI